MSNTHVEKRYIIMNKQNQYFSNVGAAYERKFSPNILDARKYTSHATAITAASEYFLNTIGSVGICEVDYIQEVTITKPCNFLSKETVLEEEIKAFEPLNDLFIEDADKMSIRQYDQWKKLRELLNSASLLEMKRDDKGQKYWVVRT